MRLYGSVDPSKKYKKAHKESPDFYKSGAQTLTNNDMDEISPPNQPEILSLSESSGSEGLEILIRVQSIEAARQLVASADFHQDIARRCTDRGVSLGYWRIVDPTGATLSRSPAKASGVAPDESKAAAKAMALEYKGNTHSLVRLMVATFESIVGDDFSHLITSPEACKSLVEMLGFALSTQLPSVITYHPGRVKRPTDHCFLFANSHLNTEIEALDHEDLAKNRDFTAPIVLDGRTIDPHWSYQPQRLADLCQTLNQEGRFDAFKYQWKNPRGQVVEGVLDYRIFEVGDLLFRASHHRDLRIVANAA